MQTEANSAGVPGNRATQAEARRARWAWAEPSVWTDRMLEALETGVKGGCWYSLIDKVYRPENLRASWRKVAANGGSGGVDHQTVEMFGARTEEEIPRLEALLRAGTYRPQAARRVWIDKPGSRDKRPLGIPTVRDRVVQGAVRQVLEPIFEATFAEHSYGFRPNRGAKDALREVDRRLKAGPVWVVDADLKGYFDSIPHDRLIERVKEQVADRPVLALIQSFLKQGVMDQGVETEPEGGTPQGGVISPLLANIYLNPLDHRMAQKGHLMVRYADDFVVLCETQAEAEAVMAELRAWTEAEGLTLHPDKTRVVDMSQPEAHFDFLGYRFQRLRSGKIGRWPRPKSLKRFQDTLRPITSRTSGQSLMQIIAQVNRHTRGWFAYFKHSYWNTFPRLDGWLRRRLRAMLEQRCGRRNGGHGAAHQRWPNAFFAEQGLFSLTEAHADAHRSA
jgi:RNA-directed DNA polymerase